MFYVLVISQSILIGQYQFFRAVIEMYNMLDRGVLKYGL